MARPKQIPVWATNANYVSGANAGSPTRVQPLSGESADGWHPDTRPPPQKFNWMHGTAGDWLDYLADVALLNVHTHTFDASNTVLDLSAVRSDGTAGIYKTPFHDAWVLLGHGTAGSIYVVTAAGHIVNSLATGAASPPHWHHGAFCTNGALRDVVFCADDFTGGAAPAYARSVAGQLHGTWTKATLPGTYSTSYPSRCLDSTSTRDGIIVAVGGGATGLINGISGDWNVWTSTDGVTWTLSAPIGRANVDFDLSRVIIGKNGRLVTWANAAAGNGGNRLCFTDNLGATWTVRTDVLTSSNIVDGCYSAVDDAYYFVHDTSIERLSDLDAGFGSIIASSTTNLSSIRDLGGVLVFLGTTTGNFTYLSMSRDSGVTSRLIQRCMTGAKNLGVDTNFGQIAVRANGGALGTTLFDRDAVAFTQRLSGTY